MKRCQVCGEKVPDTRQKTAKYCSKRCQKIAKTRRARQTPVRGPIGVRRDEWDAMY